jgi:hypothetical protein
LLFSLLRPQREAFSKYTSVEAYEIRPGILIMPRYSNNGQVCEIAVEKSHYTSTAIDLDSTLPREEFIRIVDELAPSNERGRLAIDFNDEYLSLYTGNSVTTFKEYENISINIYGKTSPKDGVRDVAATVSWKKRACGQAAAP